MHPKVSICLPNRNTQPFLKERLNSIFAQTYSNWELLVFDGFSDDGSWELINETIKGRANVTAWQGPRSAPPGCWNPCLQRATGKYVYIATSDDTMPPEFLEKMVDALDSRPDCDLAHTMLRVIDEDGNESDVTQWWRQNSLFSRSSEAMLEQPHVRHPPLDGLLHLLGESVYISMTQLLIRKTLFARIGYFSQEWGTPADFLWDMNAGMVSKTIHVPDTWGGWRIRRGQATNIKEKRSTQYRAKIDGMIEAALNNAKASETDARVLRRYDQWAHRSLDQRRFFRRMQAQNNWLSRQITALHGLLMGSDAALRYVQSKLLGRPEKLQPCEIVTWARMIAGRDVIEPCAIPRKIQNTL